MEYSEFGKFMRELRKEKKEKQKDTAKIVFCCPTLVSDVELGKKNVPKDWISVISKHYDLSEEKVKQLNTAAMLSKTSYRLDLLGASVEQRKLALEFMKKFKKLSPNVSEQIMKILEAN